MRSDVGFPAGPEPQPDFSGVTVSSGGDKRTLGIVLVVVAVIGAFVGGYLLLSGGEPPPVALDRGIEPGGTYVFNLSMRDDIDSDRGGSISQYRSSVDGLVTFKVGRTGDPLTRVKAQINPHTVVVNGTPLPDQVPLRATLKMGADGGTFCSGLFFIPWRDTRAFLPSPQLGPPLPDGPVGAGESWTIADEVRCRKGLAVRYSSTGSFTFEEREDDRRIAMISATTIVEGLDRKGRVTGEALVEESMRLDLDTSQILSADGVSTSRAGEDLREASSYRLEPVA